VSLAVECELAALGVTALRSGPQARASGKYKKRFLPTRKSLQTSERKLAPAPQTYYQLIRLLAELGGV
jgi:hypothetical protein